MTNKKTRNLFHLLPPLGFALTIGGIMTQTSSMFFAGIGLYLTWSIIVILWRIFFKGP